MATEYTCITRKIEVHLHRHGDSEEAAQRLKEEYRIWDEINDNLYKAANRIISHCFFNDAYEYRLKLHSPRFQEIEKLLKYAKRNKLTDDDIKALKAERKELFAEFKRQRQSFLGGSEQNSTYKVVTDEFLEVIPSDVLSCLNQNISSTYREYALDVEHGRRTIPNFKKGIPVPFAIKVHRELALRKREDGSIYIRFPKGLEWDLNFGRDRSNNREIVERVLSGQYDVGVSSIQEAKNGKRFLLLVVKIPKESRALNPDRVVGVDLGVNIPLYAALNDNTYGGLSIGSRDQFLNVRMRMAAQKRELQRNLRVATNGGHGRKQKLQALDRLEGKERRWVHLQNHIFSKSIIEYALRNEAGAIQMERLTGFGHDRNDEVDEGFKFILRYWSFFELQTMIEYKAKAAGIEVRYVDPYHTSQTCSFCGHYEKGQRVNQATFICKNPDCTKGKGKERSDGTFEGINADWNAARNIALSDKIVERKKK
ncbi:MAG: transposase [Rikenellaceae bacterium]|nr:transposase [Rikenellaceae bacterium]